MFIVVNPVYVVKKNRTKKCFFLKFFLNISKGIVDGSRDVLGKVGFGDRLIYSAGVFYFSAIGFENAAGFRFVTSRAVRIFSFSSYIFLLGQ